MPPRRLDAAAPGFEKDFSAFLGRNRDTDENVDRVVADIIADVRARGDAAVVEYTKKFDKVDTDAAGLRISDAERRAAAAKVPPAQREALAFAARRIEAFHRALLPKDVDFTDATGTRLGARYRPLESVGVYVPGGTAAYPSSVLMNIVPAKVAGVPRIVMVVPTPDGVLNPLVMLAAEIAGADEVWRIGGAQAVAALAYGTQSIAAGRQDHRPRQRLCRRRQAPRVRPGRHRPDRRPVGDPGRRRRRQRSRLDRRRSSVAGRARRLLAVDPDHRRCRLRRPRGCRPSRPSFWAWRAPTSRGRAGATTAASSWCPTSRPRAPIVDRIAAEHVELAMETGPAEALADRIRHAGAIFIGRHTPEAIGDYVAGTNHVLPTSRAARFSGGLGVADFLKRTSLVACTPEALAALAPAALALAEAEGLGAHGRSVSIRLNRRG